MWVLATRFELGWYCLGRFCLIEPIALLGRPWVFSQQLLLDPQDFEREARVRGFEVSEPALEAGHRLGLLVPLYTVRRPSWDVRARQRATTWSKEYARRRRWSLSKEGDGLNEHRAAGLVADGATVRFRPWARDLLQTALGRVRRREHLYSPYQLVSLPDVGDMIGWGADPSGDDLKWRRRRAVTNRQLTALLTALEPYYLPDIVWHERLRRLGESFEEYQLFRRSLDPVRLLADVAWDPADLQKQAEALLHQADARDPLAAWLPLVRQIHPDEWTKLKGTARLAIDQRIAAEMILQFLEDLAPLGGAQALPSIPPRASHPLMSRLKRDRADLDGLLMDYGLSPYPAVILGLEGETEITMVLLAMAELDIPRRDSFIHLVNAEGETRDHTLLATYAALPRLGPREGEGASFNKPPVHYVVVVDADRAFRQFRARAKLRRHLVAVLHDALPPEFRTPAARRDLAAMVHVKTWRPALDFERANFSDGELAQALVGMGLVPAHVTETQLRAQLSMNRAHGGALDAIWNRWPRKPRKPELAKALWPAMQGKLVGAGTDQARLNRIPLARVLLDAWELAVSTNRRHVVMRVGRAPRARARP